ncbi:MAG: Cation/H+ exchanger [Olpidium bornovanus]|uniref:Cation/H+ exchanger n=1 Tax=Olpidium bornovanus TaxID=278681 RepID=A0A8H7ZNE7_9FUNG|nr:MAG: Cation/H+ exchanger [Olpidium bornovanus]
MAVSESFVSGANPLRDPLALFLVQVLLIVVVSRALAVGLGYLKQPRVIAEVIGGILLGPSALSSLIANFALIFFLYLVGLELHPSSLKEKARASALVSLVGIVVPFGAGAGVMKIIYENFGDPQVPFYAFFVFGGVAMCITAFPVLARILTERRLISVPVGQTTLAAAAVDDAVAWTLLVLVVALINNALPSSSAAVPHTSNPVEAVYVFLLVLAWALLLWFAVRPLLAKFVLKTSSEQAASEMSVTVIFLLICVSAFYTQAVGVHAIFGGFLVGLITPHERGFAIKLTEKIEDLVGVLLLPLVCRAMEKKKNRKVVPGRGTVACRELSSNVPDIY